MARSETRPKINSFEILSNAQCERVSDGATVPFLGGCAAVKTLALVLPHFGDFDSLEYAWWLKREGWFEPSAVGFSLRAVGIGDRAAGQRFCDYTGFPTDKLFVDPTAELHGQLGLYEGLGWKLPGGSDSVNGWLNLLLMCAGIGSPGTLKEVFRGYLGDRAAPQLIADDEVVKTGALPAIKGETFKFAGGKGFQRPFELATLRLRNMGESLGHWETYVPKGDFLTQRGGTFVVEGDKVLYEHRDRGILGFAQTMRTPLAFLDNLEQA